MATLGEQLKAAREAAGYTTSQAAEVTRIKIQHIEELERDDFTRFAAPIYGKGFIKLYAEFLSLDPSPLLAEYSLAVKVSQESTAKAQKGGRRKEPEAPARAPAPRPAPADDKRGLRLEGRGSSATGAAGRASERPAAPSSLGERVAGVAAAVRDRVSALKPLARTPEPAARSLVKATAAPVPGTPSAIAPAAAPASAGSRGAASAGTEGGPVTPGTGSRNLALVVGVLLIVILLISGVSRCARALFSPGEKGRAAAGNAPMVLTQDPPEPYSD